MDKQLNTNPSAEAVWALANASYPTGSPWQVAQFEEDLNNPLSHYLIKESGQPAALVAFLSYQQVLDEAELFNIAVDPTYQGRGLAKALLRSFFSAVEAAGGTRIFLEVRASNLHAQALYLRTGFVIIGRRKNYYQHPEEDALIMEKKVGGQIK
ncbi:ribosomal-protein-alanine acetyltransferase [Enterococcus sp. 8G7_MSG3316]|uniref:[Ribosomal protein bS18]-alanine N-acetyltransferase n=1 Tax=Candidatus Enterococcus testudinis TaxID=1834191 RepID=A0A242A7L1_9ENTE|nr:ribosomal protein S18-alanine N-acetyltransferase [Enterococcus sp. 8G7_MSG3316]OTN77025.1 ribosomal-protein-alanine acetyltransferase [Enterococcus sp. 8G7_MSG3316]